jgi:hypothetical protein
VTESIDTEYNAAVRETALAWALVPGGVCRTSEHVCTRKGPNGSGWESDTCALLGQPRTRSLAAMNKAITQEVPRGRLMREYFVMSSGR